jgi:hypothetical protein
MDFTFTVNVHIERTEGKFATKDEMEEQLIQALADANPNQLDGDDGGVYEVTDWDIESV